MTIKIQCQCGSKYSFEVEPVEGRMPFAVHCPTCNAEGTDAANQFIAQAAGQPRLRVQTAPAAAVDEPPPRPRAPAAVSAMERLHRERRQFRVAGWIASAVALVILALLGAWGWFAWVGSKPRLSYSVKVPGAEAGWHSEFMGPGIILMVSPDRAIAHDLNAGKDLWSVSLSDKASDEGMRPQTYIDKDSIWICLGSRVVRLNRATGEMKQTIPITGQIQSFAPSDTSLLVVSAENDTTRLACRIDLGSGEVSTDQITVPRAQKQALPNELPP